MMNRDEVTKLYFDKIDKSNNSRYIPSTIKEANKLWWRQTNTKSWRLTEMGFIQMSNHSKLPVWDFSCDVSNERTIFNGKVIVALEKLKCPWYCRIVYNTIDKFWMCGEEESMCMALCNGDINRFLEVWECQ